MDKYLVTNKKSKIQILCMECSSEDAKKLYNAIVCKRKGLTKATECNWYSNITLKDHEFLLFTNITITNDLYAKLQADQLAITSLDKANKEMHLNCKFLQEQNRRLQAEVQEKKAEIIELKKRPKSKPEKVEESIKEATASTVKKSVKKTS